LLKIDTLFESWYAGSTCEPNIRQYFIFDQAPFLKRKN